MRTTATALCLSVAEYCCPAWARSTHRKLIDTALNETCHLITGCIRPTATPDLYVHRPTGNKALRPQSERAHQTTNRPRQRNICGVPGEQNLYVRRDHIMTNCRHFGKRSNRDGMSKLEGRAVRWLSAVADTT